MSAPPVIIATGSLANIYDALVAAGPFGISAEYAIDIVVAAGGSSRDSRIIGWRISRLRDKLKPEGWSIRATARGGSTNGRFILEPIGTPPARIVLPTLAETLGIGRTERRVFGDASVSTAAGVLVSVARVSFIDGARP